MGARTSPHCQPRPCPFHKTLKPFFLEHIEQFLHEIIYQNHHSFLWLELNPNYCANALFSFSLYGNPHVDNMMLFTVQSRNRVSLDRPQRWRRLVFVSASFFGTLQLSWSTSPRFVCIWSFFYSTPLPKMQDICTSIYFTSSVPPSASPGSRLPLSFQLSAFQ